MASILLHDTDVLRLAAAVNQARTEGMLPTGGLLFTKGQYFQLLITGSSTVNYTIIAEPTDVSFTAKANIVAGLGAFALGTPLLINGFFVQAFGDMAGSGGGGDAGDIYGTSNALGVELATIDMTSLPAGTLVLNATGLGGGGLAVVDGSSILLNFNATPGLFTVGGDPAGGTLSMGTALTEITGPGGQGSIRIDANGFQVMHPGAAAAVATTTGTSSADGAVALRRPFSSVGEGELVISNTGIALRHPGVTDAIVETTGSGPTTGTLTIRRPFSASTGLIRITPTGMSLIHPNRTEIVLETTGDTDAACQLNMRRPFNTTRVLAADNTSTSFRGPSTTTQIRIDANTTALTSAGTLALTVASTGITPGSTATQNIGTSSLRFNGIFLATAPDVSSDATHKTAPQAIPDAALDAVGDVDLVQFKLLAAIALKGEEQARLHTGVIAQQLKAAFEAHGVDATDYGLLCYDEWEAQEEVISPEVLNEKGEVIEPAYVITPAVPAGSMWSVRYEELLILEAARVRRELSKLSSK